jgi:hypothetical protein
MSHKFPSMNTYLDAFQIADLPTCYSTLEIDLIVRWIFTAAVGAKGVVAVSTGRSIYRLCRHWECGEVGQHCPLTSHASCLHLSLACLFCQLGGHTSQMAQQQEVMFTDASGQERDSDSIPARTSKTTLTQLHFGRALLVDLQEVGSNWVRGGGAVVCQLLRAWSSAGGWTASRYSWPPPEHLNSYFTPLERCAEGTGGKGESVRTSGIAGGGGGLEDKC